MNRRVGTAAVRPRLTPGGRPQRGIFVTVDGPNGVGKTSSLAVLHRLLRRDGLPVRLTAEPSTSALGKFVRRAHTRITGLPLACLVAADRYEHLTREIEPALAKGHIVVCDRYIESSLVFQVLDGVDTKVIWRLNSQIRRPDLSVLLLATARVLNERLDRRGRQGRYELHKASSGEELSLYRRLRPLLSRRGFNSVTMECSSLTIGAVARRLRRLILEIVQTSR